MVSNGAQHSGATNQLTANDVFATAKSLMKRPSTMVASDAIDQVAEALQNSSTAGVSAPVSVSPTPVGRGAGPASGARSGAVSVAAKLNLDAGSQAPMAAVQARNRRQAIVPPKLSTDNTGSDGELSGGPAEGQLVDLGPDSHSNSSSNPNSNSNSNANSDDNEHGNANENEHEREHGHGHGHENGAETATKTAGKRAQQRALDYDEATVRALRRKRSGGGPSSAANQATDEERLEGRRFSSAATSQAARNLPALVIEPDSSEPDGRVSGELQRSRPDSQATNSSGSSTNLSLSKQRELSVTSPGGLSVSFGLTRGRRRSSIAVIPQMQICPGDLLVYSKQLIDRMNQSDETEPPQFLTIDDKKGKNIWSSFKLFDNRTMKARNELLCSLEDVLASLQPSTFVDEQLSHYKGMLWNEFLYETESRRSASSEALAQMRQSDEETGDLVFGSIDASEEAARAQHADAPVQAGAQASPAKSRIAIGQPTSSAGVCATGSSSAHRESVKVSLSTGLAGQAGVVSSSSPAKASGVKGALTSRFKEKPKLKRGQTVDSVFRIPLIPSSPLKHAQQHQQRPTAHLEDQDLLLTIEDDEHGSPSASNEDKGAPETPSHRAATAKPRNQSNASATRHQQQQSPRSGGAPSRCSINLDGSGYPLTGGVQNQQNADTNLANNRPLDLDSSFEADDALDLLGGGGQTRSESHGVAPSSRSSRQANQFMGGRQMMRQSSLSTLSSTITKTEQKRQRALWDLFQSECTFFFDHLLTLKNVYMEPLKKIQVEGFAMFADPDVLFGNLDELCCGVYDFCKEFLYIIMRTLKTRPEELNATDVLIKLYKKNPKIDHLRGVYHRYTLNYINALTYLESLRRQVEFVEFEKWSSRDVRCKKLQLTDLLVAPVQHIMRVPIILKDIESHTENLDDRDEIRAILAIEEASLRELDDKMRWLKNFERLLEIQKNINWPSVLDMDPKLFVPEFLREVLSKQPCEKLIVSPRRQIVHEGTLSNFDSGRVCDMHVILFDDMLLMTRRKKGLTKKASTVCKTNSGGSSSKDDSSFKYIVYRQPLSLDRFYVHDVQQVDAQNIGMKFLFLLIVMNRFQQITSVHSFCAPNDDMKQTWLFKIKKTAERWKRNLSSAGEQEQARGLHLANQQQHQEAVSPLKQAASPCRDQSASSAPRAQSQSAQQQQQQQYQVHSQIQVQVQPPVSDQTGGQATRQTTRSLEASPQRS